jgi:hypothetical protein
MVLALHGRHCPEKNHAFLKRKNWKPVSTWLSLHSQTPLKISNQRPLVQFYWAPDIFSCFRFKNQITKSSWFRCMLKEKSFSSSGDHSGPLNTRCKLHVPGVNFTHPIFLPCWFMSVVIFLHTSHVWERERGNELSYRSVPLIHPRFGDLWCLCKLIHRGWKGFSSALIKKKSPVRLRVESFQFGFIWY